MQITPIDGEFAIEAIAFALFKTNVTPLGSDFLVEAIAVRLFKAKICSNSFPESNAVFLNSIFMKKKEAFS